MSEKLEGCICQTKKDGIISTRGLKEDAFLYEDVIQRNNLWRFFHPHREKAVTRDEAR